MPYTVALARVGQNPSKTINLGIVDPGPAELPTKDSLLWEGFRRQDLIRHGKFLEAWTHKDASDGDHRVLYPIPQSQLDANPNLVQNSGY